MRRPSWAHPAQLAGRVAASVGLARSRIAVLNAVPIAMPIVVLFAALGTGCAPSPSSLGFASDDPGAILPAIQKAAATRDVSAVPHLVDALRSDDPAVRLMAQDALQEITGSIRGTDVGYRHFDPPAERQAAIDRWTARLRREGWLPDASPPTSPVSAPASDASPPIAGTPRTTA